MSGMFEVKEMSSLRTSMVLNVRQQEYGHMFAESARMSVYQQMVASGVSASQPRSKTAALPAVRLQESLHRRQLLLPAWGWCLLLPTMQIGGKLNSKVDRRATCHT